MQIHIDCVAKLIEDWFGAKTKPLIPFSTSKIKFQRIVKQNTFDISSQNNEYFFRPCGFVIAYIVIEFSKTLPEPMPTDDQ